jgi:hypothetical protein
MGGESTRKALEKGSNYGAGGMGRDAAEKQNKERSQRATRSNQINKISGTLKTGTDAARERALADASNAQILEMLKEDDSKKLLMENAGKLSTSQFDAVVKSEDIDDKYRGDLGAQRAKQIGDRLRQNPDGGEPLDMASVIGKADIADLKALGFETAVKHAGMLSAKQIEDWKDLTPSEKGQIKAARKKQIGDEFKTDPDKLFKRISSDEERSKLSDDILTDEKAAPHLNNNVLTKIVDNNGITQAQRSLIKGNVIKHHYTPEVQNYESESEKYRRASATYNAMDSETKKTTQAPTPPDKPASVGKYEKVLEYFEKNNAGQRY